MMKHRGSMMNRNILLETKPAKRVAQLPLVDQFREAVRTVMRKRKLSAYQVCKIADVSVPHFYKAMHGEKTPGIAWCERVAKALGITFKVQV